MEKKNYGEVVYKITKKVDNELFIDEKKVSAVISDMINQLNVISDSLASVSNILGKSIELGVTSKTRSDVFRELKRKAKTQSDSAKKLSETLTTKYGEDITNYPIKLLDDRIAAVEKRIAELS